VTVEDEVVEGIVTKEELRRRELRGRVIAEANFVNAKRFDNSRATLEARYPDGCPEHVMASALVLTVEEVRAEDERITGKLRNLMGVDL
jgi:hypothetical protein